MPRDMGLVCSPMTSVVRSALLHLHHSQTPQHYQQAVMAPQQFNVTPEKEASILNFIYRQIRFTPRPVTGDLAGKTAIVTGASSGVGLEVCHQLVGLGVSKLIVAVRNEEKGKRAAEDIRSGGATASNCSVDVWKLDLSLYDSVVAFADRAKSLPRLDIAVLNAGLVFTSHEINSTTEHDETIQVNYLSTALLMVLLLQVPKTSGQQGPLRVTMTSSEVAAWTSFKERSNVPLLPAFDAPGKVNPTDRMMVSKLLGQFFLKELATRVPSSLAIVNCATPGMVHDSQFNRHIDQTFGGRMVKFVILRRLGYTATVGARHITDAVVNHGEESHGHFLSEQMIKP